MMCDQRCFSVTASPRIRRYVATFDFNRGLAMKKFLIATALTAIAFAATATLTRAADMALKASAAAPVYCSAGNCNGAYATFGVSNNANLGGVLTGGANNGLGINLGAGYQYWQGQVIAGFEVTGGYQFGTAGSTGTATSTQFVKLGYNFFPSTASAPPTAGQSPFLGLVPANILANSTPSIIAGGCYGHGIEKGCIGMEVDSVLSAGWSSAFQYYNAPSQAGQADENVFRIMAQKHF
jgi:hypothetical protein